MSIDFRYGEDTGFERRCPLCRDWWPLELTYWDKRWLTRCRACIKTWRAEYQAAKYRDDPEYRQMKKDAAALSSWKALQNEPERFRARRAAYERTRDVRRRELQRLNYWANRDAILARRRKRASERNENKATLAA